MAAQSEIPWYHPDPRIGMTIADLIMRGGDIQARRAEQSGAIWANALQNLGGIAANVVQQRQQEKQQKQREAMFDQAVSEWDPANPGAFYRSVAVAYGPEMATSAVRAFAALEQSKQQAAPDPKLFAPKADFLRRMYKTNPEWLQKNWGGIVPAIAPDVKAIYGMDLTPEWQPEYGQALEAMGEEDEAKVGTRLVERTLPDGTKVQEIVEDRPGQAFTSSAPVTQKEYQVTVPGPNGPVTKLVGADELRGGVREYQRPPAALVVNPEKEEDARTLAQQLIDGRITPGTLSKRGDYNHVVALADRLSQQQGKGKLNLTKLQLDYASAARHVAAMNGPQMVRFRALAESVVNTMDEVKLLAEELKQGGIQKWNQAKRDTILEVYGNTPQSGLAARYVSAVNTLKEEFANLAQGGYAPTEDAWELANQQINGNFGLKDMTASLTEAQRLINYRMEAFTNLAPQFIGGAGSVGGALGGLPAAPPAATSAPAGTEPARPKAVPANYHWDGNLRLWVP